MGLLYAVLLASIATAHCGRFRWTTEMIIKNPENNPFLNDAALGPLQYLWKVLFVSYDNVFILESLHAIPGNTKCWVTAAGACCSQINIRINLVTDYFTFSWNATMWMRFFVQNDYTIENVIRGSFNEPPKEHTIPQGSNNYIRYNDDDCDPSSIPFQEGKLIFYAYPTCTYNATTEYIVPMRTDIDFYVVYNQPECNVLRIDKECDLWLRSNELQVILEAAVREAETNAPEEEEDA
ncbi:secreted histamine binding protein, putative, partial [Ixodes scapularis]